ncbi:hypothetical protein [Sabulicella glaciei]|uniref:Uncharacterized protein n=1 Tax=Sabulicella glaciei TaxID=2984948 RepID=A0ABT3P219_9PROT|nr:hypothetical protein [Roseococcus sp. MDT2-1-1]MCW8088462.1 hypothetical protein [Roseococcus sp. MDT2-1-1]
MMGSGGHLGCANHVERGTCDNPRTLLRDRLLTRVLVGLKERLLAPELVAKFVRTYVAETNAASCERGQRRAGLVEKLAKLNRQIRNFLELIKDGHGSAALVGELRPLEHQQAALTAELAAAGTAEPVPVLHPNLPKLYRRKVEALEVALQDPNTAAAEATALRGLIDAILIVPGARRAGLRCWSCGATWPRCCTSARRPRNAKRPFPWWGTAVLEKCWKRGMRGQDLNL